jgi:hypothetical protein
MVHGFDEEFVRKHEAKMAGIRGKAAVPAVPKCKTILPQDLPCPLEEAEQVTLAQFLDLMFKDQWAHWPNGGMRPSSFDKDGKRFSVEAKKLKAQGLKSGLPDVFIFRPVKGAPGVVVELKRRKGGIVSDDQKKWLKTLSEFGWITFVAHGADAGIKFIRETYNI